jgi:glyoxylase I family protein
VPQLGGLSHLDLTVTDVERSAEWWERVMGFSRVNSAQYPTWRICSLMDAAGFAVTVMSHDSTTDEQFDETRVGLDHFAFAVESRSALDEWVAHFDAHGVTHTGVIEAHFGDTVVFRDPDNIQLELFLFDPRGGDVAGLIEADPHRAG